MSQVFFQPASVPTSAHQFCDDNVAQWRPQRGPRGPKLAKPNYQFEKRQRELAKKKKKEEKIQQRRSGAGEPGAPDADQEGTDGEGATPDNAESGEDTGSAPPAAEASA